MIQQMMLCIVSEHSNTTITREQPVQLLLPVLLMMLRCTLIDSSHIGVMTAVAAAAAVTDEETALRMQHNTLNQPVTVTLTVTVE
jgi:hypothetical protein